MPIRSIFKEVESAKAQVENLSVEELVREIRHVPELLLVDLRELQERLLLGTIPGARHVPRGMLEFWADPQSPYARDYFAEHRRTVLFCAAGSRSALAAVKLKEMGFKDVAHLESGFARWRESGQEIEDANRKSRWVQKMQPQRPQA